MINGVANSSYSSMYQLLQQQQQTSGGQVVQQPQQQAQPLPQGPPEENQESMQTQRVENTPNGASSENRLNLYA